MWAGGCGESLFNAGVSQKYASGVGGCRELLFDAGIHFIDVRYLSTSQPERGAPIAISWSGHGVGVSV